MGTVTTGLGTVAGGNGNCDNRSGTVAGGNGNLDTRPERRGEGGRLRDGVVV